MSKAKRNEVAEAALATCEGCLKWSAGPFGTVRCTKPPDHPGLHHASWLDRDNDWHSIDWTDLDAFRAAISE